jgi:transposase
MLIVETIAKIRRAHLVQGKSIKAIARELRVSRKVVRKVLRSAAWTSHSGGLSISDRSNTRSVITASGVRSMATRREEWFNVAALERSTRMETGI